MKAKTNSKLALLEGKSSLLSIQIGGISKATSATWDTVKAETQEAYLSLENGVVESALWIQEKV